MQCGKIMQRVAWYNFPRHERNWRYTSRAHAQFVRFAYGAMSSTTRNRALPLIMRS